MIGDGIKADDLFGLTFVSDPQFSPDGKKVVFVQRTINDDKKYESHLYVINLTNGKIIPFTQGESNDTSPRWAPDGETIAFVSDRSGKPQIWTIPTGGGEARQLTDCPNGVAQPVWSPDGTHILLTVPLKKGERPDDRREEGQEKDETGNEPYVAERLKYKSDADGFWNGQYKQLALVNVDNGTYTLLTEGEYDHTEACFSPDGQRIAFVTNRTDDPDRHLISDIYELSLHTRSLNRLTQSDGFFIAPNYSHCGRLLSVLGHKKEFMGATLTRIWTIDIEAKQLTCLTENWDVEASDAAINDMGTSTGNVSAVWANNGEDLFFLGTTFGKTQLYKVTRDRHVHTVAGGERQIYAFSLNHAEGNAVIAVSDSRTPGDLFSVSLQDGKERRLTEANASWLADKTVSPPDEFSFTARDGLSIQGWIIKPIGFEKGKKYPLVVEIHGGPHAMYSYAFMHEFQVLASKGYGVLFINPRGSHGYGQTFVDAVRGDYGGNDYNDVIDAVHAALERHTWIDQERLGVTGGSYGGFMTNWIVGHTNMFKAAVTQRSICNWLSFYGTSDIGYFFTEWELKNELIDNPEKLWEHSPLCYVQNIQTPLLILHGENDYRCPIEQAEQLFVALKHHGKTTRFVRFPNANHELSRSGDPSLRVARLREITNWFDRYIGTGKSLEPIVLES